MSSDMRESPNTLSGEAAPVSRRGSTGDSFESVLAQQLKNLAGEPDEGIAPAAGASRNIAASISAAVMETSVSCHARQLRTPLPHQMNVPELVDEEFQARVIAVVRTGLVQRAESGSEIDRRQLAWFDKAVADGTIVVRRAEQVEGLRYRASGSVPYDAQGRIGDDEPLATWDDDFIISQMAQFNSVILGTGGAAGGVEIGHYYVSFPNPDVSLTFDQHLFRLARRQAEES